MRYVVEITENHRTRWIPCPTLADALALPVPAAPGLQRIIKAR